MATTAQQVFELAMGIMDELTQNGAVDPQNTAEYRARTPKLLTLLQSEIASLEGVETTLISNLTDNMAISDNSCIMILPWGLANLLVLEENETLAAFCKVKYDKFLNTMPCSETDITDVYLELGW